MTQPLDDFFADLPPRLDVPTVAELLGVTTKGVYRWIHTGVIPAYKLGSSWIILRDELRDTLAAGANVRLPPGEASAED
jgi:excisionase family DNA binding protein